MHKKPRWRILVHDVIHKGENIFNIYHVVPTRRDLSDIDREPDNIRDVNMPNRFCVLCNNGSCRQVETRVEGFDRVVVHFRKAYDA